MLLSYLQQKLEAVIATKLSSESILRSYGIDPGNGDLLRNDADVRALFIYYYRSGQERILSQCIDAITAKLESLLNDEDEENEDSS
jgi:hypothetical protein